jgi:hypothetical protein
MSTAVKGEYSIALSEAERNVLLQLLQDVLKETQVEEHRTDRFAAKEVVRARGSAIESLLKKARAATAD